MKRLLNISISVAATLGGYALPGYTQPPGELSPTQIRQIEQQRHPMGSLRGVEQTARNGAVRSGERIRPLTPKERKAIEALKAPKPEDAATYSEFLKLEGTGMARLFPGYECESKYIVPADGACVKVLPNTASLIFRDGGISGDIVFTKGNLVADGFFALSIMTNLGNVPIEHVSLSTPGMQFLTDLVPETDIGAVKKQYAQIGKGVTANDRVYTNRLAALPGTTYAVRIIAYKNGNNINKRWFLYRANIPFSGYGSQSVRAQMEKDQRIDLTIGFRVVRKDDDGGITLIWKELARKKAPKIILPDHMPLRDFK